MSQIHRFLLHYLFEHVLLYWPSQIAQISQSIFNLANSNKSWLLNVCVYSFGNSAANNKGRKELLNTVQQQKAPIPHMDPMYSVNTDVHI